MPNNISLLKDSLSQYGVGFRTDEPMSRRTSFKIGGPASLFVTPLTEAELALAVGEAKRLGVKYFVLGRGTNVVFSDEGFSGAVISTLEMNEVKIEGEYLTALCGAALSKCAIAARDASLGGLEFAHGIPGSVGGAVFMNAGAYGGEISGILESSTYLDSDSGKLTTIANEENAFGYRDSIFRHMPNYVVTSAKFKLFGRDKDEISAEIAELDARRRDKQPLEFPSAGSAFKRPIGNFAGKLIEDAGLKGASVGGAQVSEKHAGFIINKGGATAADVRSLVGLIKERIISLYGVELECEILFVD